LFLVFPGVIAFVMFNGDLTHADGAYPALVREILPSWAYGIFGAIIFGTILSTYTAALNSVSTLFAFDFYKGVFNKSAPEEKVVTVGKCINICIALVSIALAPILINAPTGLYNFLQEYIGFYNIPLIIIILFGFFNSRVSAIGAKFCFFMHLILYIIAKLLLPDVHFLYIHSVLFFLDILVIFSAIKYRPLPQAFVFQSHSNKVDLTPWKYRKIAATIVVLGVITLYLIFSPLGIAK
ncbi:MAG TPA: solute:sodium symporter family transporter, partial [Pasteurellaceae bacterium]|nr:solute:sodium symporter family transporter [Pasteurellaceae bacterium]